MVENKEAEVVEKKPNGSRNLVVLGVSSVVIALVTSLVSLYLYHASGDIYLDCSLPDADCPSARANSEENNRDQAYVFQDTGNLDEKVIDEYLKEIKNPIERSKKTIETLDDDVLSNESLGI